MLDKVVKIPLCVVRALLFAVVFKMSGNGNNKPTLGVVERDHELKIMLKGRVGSYKDTNVTYFKSNQSTFWALLYHYESAGYRCGLCLRYKSP